MAKAKNNQTPAQPQQNQEQSKNQAQEQLKQTQEVKEQNKQAGQQKPKSQKKKYRSLSRFIEVFEHKGVRYMIHPNSVVENLPEDAPQVQKLIKEKKLVEVK